MMCESAMLKKSKQRHYLVRNEKKWQKRLKDFGMSHDAASLHGLRVTIKKIKAFASFSNDCSGKGAMKDFHLLRKMFHQAGVIRDAGNQLHLLEHFHPSPEFYKHEQEEVQSTATQNFVNHIKQYQKKGKKAGRRLLADIHSVRPDRIRDWYAAQLIRTSVLLSSTGDSLHKARKQIKGLLYVLDLLPSRLVEKLHLDRAYLDDLQEAIGNWHDAVVVVDALSEKELAGAPAMMQLCFDKEADVRSLAGEFYRRVHMEK